MPRGAAQLDDREVVADRPEGGHRVGLGPIEEGLEVVVDQVHAQAVALGVAPGQVAVRLGDADDLDVAAVGPTEDPVHVGVGEAGDDDAHGDPLPHRGRRSGRGQQRRCDRRSDGQEGLDGRQGSLHQGTDSLTGGSSTAQPPPRILPGPRRRRESPCLLRARGVAYSSLLAPAAAPRPEPVGPRARTGSFHDEPPRCSPSRSPSLSSPRPFRCTGVGAAGRSPTWSSSWSTASGPTPWVPTVPSRARRRPSTASRRTGSASSARWPRRPGTSPRSRRW